MNRLRETAWFEEGSRRKLWALLGAYALVALTVVTSTSSQPALAAPPTYRDVATATTTVGGSLVINVPAATQPGDVMLAQITYNAWAQTITPPGGWNFIRQDANSGGIIQELFWRAATASEPASYTWGLSSGDMASGAIVSYAGVDNASPIDDHNGQAPGSGSTLTAPSITTTVTDATLVAFYGIRGERTVASPGSMAERWDLNTAGGAPDSSNATSAGADETFATPGPTGTRVATVGTDGHWAAALVALTPSPPSPTFRSVGTGSAQNTTSITINTPPGVVAGDVMIAQVTAHEKWDEVTPPAGWTFIRSDRSVGQEVSQGLWWKVASGSEPPSYTWTIDKNATMSGSISAYTGVDTSNPIDAHGGQINSNTTAVQAPSITTRTQSTLLVGLWGVVYRTSVTPPASMVERWDIDNGGGGAPQGSTSAGSDEVWAAVGATGIRTATAADSASNVGQLIALAPAGFGTPTNLEIAGTVFEDIGGNTVPGLESIGDVDNPGIDGVDVFLYEDDGDGLPGLGDPSLGSATTAGGGLYTFPGLDATKDHWVVVDARDPQASQDPAEPASNIWAEQTYGPSGSLCADGIGGTAARTGNGACYGGRRGEQSDSLATWYTDAEHLALIQFGGGDVTTEDFGFSFNVVTTLRGGDTADDDLANAGRSVQGSLRQFLTNANALAGANAMRFVPAEATNAAGGGGAWWRVDATAAFPAINDADTTVDGTAYGFNGTVRDDNPGAVGTGGTVGVGVVPLAQVARSELQIDGRGLLAIDNGALVPHRTTIRALSITESGARAIQVNNVDQVAPVADDIVLEDLIIGMPPVWQPQILPTGTDAGIHLNAVNRATLRNSFIGWTNGRTLNVETSTDAVIRGNEFRDTNEDVIDIYQGSSGTLFENNLVSGGLNWGLDITVSSSTTLRNNTVDSAGDGAGQTGGVRLFGPGSTIDRNVFSNNNGPAIMIAGTMTTSPRAAGEAVITQNAFINNNGLSIDLQAASED
ncbi:MAG: right-handed parallel beta-helix repeat-containing protein, partial [Acidimicrobiia bacterium]|nr:right-handed parallel beta-helix repeat-containing protein [Acidimicrobiia bacterium]